MTPARKMSPLRIHAAMLAAMLAGCTGEHEPLAARIDSVVAPLVAAHEFSGAVAVSREGLIIYERGFGMANHEAGVPFTPATPADGGSLAKTLTAAGIFLLAYEGRIDPDAPVRRYLREYPFDGTTVRQLISHTNGLPPYYEFWDPFFAQGEVRTTQEMLDIVSRELPAPAFAPGSRFEYSNFGFDVAALVIERITGQTIERFLEQRFFSRLGMESSFARPARFADWPGVRTMGYRWQDGGWRVVDVYDGEAFVGASNVYFSAADLARWAGAQVRGPAIAPGAFAAGQQRPAIGGRPSPITGLSWYCNPAGSRCYYTGSLNAFHSLAYWDRERIESVAFVSNSSLPPWATITLQRNLVAAVAGLPVAEDPPVEFLRIDEAARASLAGAWAADDGDVLTLTADAGGLQLQVGPGLQFDAFQVSAEVLYVPGPDYWIAFSDAGGSPSMHVRSMFVDFQAQRRP